MKKSIPLLVSLCILITAFFTLISCPGKGGDEGPLIITMELIYQHKDTPLMCQPCDSDIQLTIDPHPENHAAGPDGLYGNSDDCPHCSAFCAPASIAMIAKAYGRTGVKIEQDLIYDEGKQSHGEAQQSGIIETHGVGMYHGAGATPFEVQAAFAQKDLYAARVKENSDRPQQSIPSFFRA